MPDLPKQELDELFREGAGMQQFEYNEAAWDKMEGMLDNDDKNRKVGMWLLLLVGVALAVMAGLYYTSLDKTSTPQETIYASENTISNTSSTENQVTQKEVKEQEVNQASANIVEANTEEVTTITIGQSKENSTQSMATDERAVTNKNLASSSAAINTNLESNYTGNISPAESQNNISNNTVSDQLKDVVNNTATSVLSSSNNKISKSELVSRALIELIALQNNELGTLQRIEHKLQNDQSKVKVAIAEYDDEDSDSSIASKLSYTVFAAPEWSSIGMDGTRKMGYKFGAKIGYQLSDKFELSTGLSISQKKFNGAGSQFTITEGWVDNIMPMTMEAKCNVIEIPLDLNYHFSGVGNTGLVAGLGLRSYMLHSEWYGFEYHPADYKPGLDDEIIKDNENKNWVGSIELSLGYTKTVSDNLSVQIVPYLQIPVTGIGEGKVDLYSGGVQFAARFGRK